ncbi:MAG: heavy-metal-associated domain-containing protein [Acidobacteriaceae bacterium]|nr:heavy-metal-associated domain-containing protein [Acidobacteriaceae bacterium]
MTNKTELSLRVTGMHCEACVRRLSVALGKMPGVEVEKVEVGSARLRYDPQATSPDQIAQAVEKAGFGPEVQ